MELRRLVLRVLVGATVVASGAGILALLRGELTDTDLRVMATSLLFAVATTLAAAGAALLPDRRRARARLGTLTVAATALAFAGLTVALWAEPEREWFWRPVLCLSIAALEGAHASFALARRRVADRPATVAAARIALVGTAASAVLTLVPAAIPLDPPDDQVEAYGKLLGAVLVVQLAATVVASLLRRLVGGAPERPLLAAEDPADRLRREVVAAADRIERLTGDTRVRGSASVCGPSPNAAAG